MRPIKGGQIGNVDRRPIRFIPDFDGTNVRTRTCYLAHRLRIVRSPLISGPTTSQWPSTCFAVADILLIRKGRVRFTSPSRVIDTLVIKNRSVGFGRFGTFAASPPTASSISSTGFGTAMTERMSSTVGHLQQRSVLSKLVGGADNFIRVVETLPDIARSDATALISGETGTGKELVARAIHYLSDRASRPLVCVNCASLPELLIEDMLFGHEPGAFTDARISRRGFLAEAIGGTLFLDEVESLTLRAQAALLRVLQDGTFYPLGSARQQRSDARIVGATNTPLEEMVRRGEFRSDSTTG